jgi:hypothetical protein
MKVRERHFRKTRAEVRTEATESLLLAWTRRFLAADRGVTIEPRT